MKKYGQFLKELPSRKAIFAVAEFKCITRQHSRLINSVAKSASTQDGDAIIFCTSNKSNVTSILSKTYPKIRFITTSNLANALALMSSKYKNVIGICTLGQEVEFKKTFDKLKKTLKFDTMTYNVVLNDNPDKSCKMMIDLAKKGEFDSFKKLAPGEMMDLDIKKMFNLVRGSIGVEPIKEQIKFETSVIREKYRAGNIFNIGDKVTDGEAIFEVVDRGANYITVVNENGNMSKKWLDSVQPICVKEDVQSGYPPKEISFKGYVTKNLHHSADATQAFQATIERYNGGQIKDAVAILNALKATDAYMKINDYHLAQGEAPDQKDLTMWKDAHNKARESLNRIGEFMHHMDYWHMHEHEIQDMENKYTPATVGQEFADSYNVKGQLTEMKFTSSDKLKVAKVIASSLGLVSVDKMTSPELIINTALRKIRNKQMQPEYVSVLENMLSIADEAGIAYDKSLVPSKVQEAVVKTPDNTPSTDASAEVVNAATPNKMGHTMNDDPEKDHLRKLKVKYRLGEEKDDENEEEDDDNDDMEDSDIDQMIAGMSDDDYLEAYDDDELHMVDSDTGEHVGCIKEELINEVLSRAERIKAKVRFARSESKRERKIQIALRTHSSNTVINKRARRLAVNLMKQKLARKPLNKLTVGEKERIERIIAKRKATINRIAMKLAPKIKKIETDRLTHRSFTK
jgi:hypothetical protein